MLRLTGRTADGWIPTLAYAAPAELGPMTRIIDQAAHNAGRDPAAIRRIYNISGRFSSVERGFLDGPSEVWVAQLTDLVLEYGFSAFVLGPAEDAVGDLERFAEEVAPGVREAVAAIRRGEQRAPVEEETAPEPPVSQPVEIIRSVPTPHSPLLHEDTRPHAHNFSHAPMTPAGQASQQTLLQVHEHLRQELAEIQRAADAVAGGRLDPGAARSLLNRMAMRQNYWTLGSFCAQYCRVVTVHHTIEDRHMFPALQREDEALSAVLTRLHEEHEVIAHVIERFDRALVAMVTDPSGVAQVRQVGNELSDALLSHLAYEEDELLGPLGRSSIVV
jgi:hemerythrin-like domain-containing protein